MQVFLTNAIERLLKNYKETGFFNISHRVSYVLRWHHDKNVAITPFLKSISTIFCCIHIVIPSVALS